MELSKIGSGKVRDLYAVDDQRLLLVASDRISAYDVVLSDFIPDKGRVLTGLSLFFFDLLDTPNHLISTSLNDLGDVSETDLDWLRGRSMIVRRAEVIPVECVVRGYLYGSSWREYRSGGGPTTEHLGAGLVMGDKLSEPIFTPSTKATTGHDENLDEAGACNLIGHDLYQTLRELSIAIYRKAADHAATKGVILADTKFEFGFAGDDLLLIDEVLTPDSSRYWPADRWTPGHDVPSFDKQFVRNWLDQSGWDHNPPAPSLPAEVIAGTRDRYIEAYERITGHRFTDYLQRLGRVD
ncbi:MAG TPA: phosphoribosylaminoimidazolesuccinocarboxamide synthase [Acidimicrobiia bacterium]|nr:phosphoribosylaminoimidazolesuccinocarboxamide synthase [Acidimicrobiia bacterium]